jgi:dihydroflavonol-4-reductase
MIAITGATGCVGSHVARRLVEDGHRVRALCLPDESLPDTSALAEVRNDVEFVPGDVRDAAAVDRLVSGSEAVFHLAAVAGLARGLGSQMWDVNVVGTRHIISAARRHGVRLVHTSSVAAIGRPVNGIPADETHVFRPAAFNHPYPLTKNVGERNVLRAARAGLDAVVVNPGPVLAGGGSPSNTWSGLILAASRGLLRAAPPGGTAVVTRQDVVNAHLGALHKGQSGERYIAVTENMSYAGLLELVHRRLGKPPRRATTPAPLLHAAAVAASMRDRFVRDPKKRLPLNRGSLPFFLEKHFFDNSKARDQLGLRPSDVGVAIDEMILWCRAAGLLVDTP